MPPPFQATFKGRDIWGIPLPRSGFQYSAALEWGLVALAWGGGWQAFVDLDGDTQAYLIAVYRAKQRMAAIEAKDQADRERRAARRQRGNA